MAAAIDSLAPARLTFRADVRVAARASSIHRITMAIEVNRLYLIVAALLFSSCVTTSTHQFTSPTGDWQTRNGQLLYRTPKTRVIGEVFVRFSRASDFELTFSKGPVTLFVLRQDQKFAEVKGPLAGRGWAGPVDRAPQQLRGWLELRDEILRARDRRQVRHVSGPETFVFRF
ncbi:MAG TPA: hypothetical protein VNX27_12900 [Chthoniobacterales bacterium]|jgi:hypothetical protein|nr:hypothetical protein [Chthoniobacterales bacterium]